ncbi:hypothetical protein [Streptomyces sp. NPDC053367]
MSTSVPVGAAAGGFPLAVSGAAPLVGGRRPGAPEPEATAPVSRPAG